MTAEKWGVLEVNIDKVSELMSTGDSFEVRLTVPKVDGSRKVLILIFTR